MSGVEASDELGAVRNDASLGLPAGHNERLKGARDPFVVAAKASVTTMRFAECQSQGNRIVFVNDAFLKLTSFGRSRSLNKPLAFALRGAADCGWAGSVIPVITNGENRIWDSALELPAENGGTQLRI